MRVLPLIMWLGLFTLLIGLLFLTPPETTGFAIEYNPIQRTVWGALFGTVGIGGLAFVGIGLVKKGDKKEERKQGPPTEGPGKYNPKYFQDALFESYKADPDNFVYGLCKEANLSPDLKIKKKDVYGVVKRLSERLVSLYGADESVASEAAKKVINASKDYARIDEVARGFMGYMMDLRYGQPPSDLGGSIKKEENH